MQAPTHEVPAVHCSDGQIYKLDILDRDPGDLGGLAAGSGRTNFDLRNHGRKHVKRPEYLVPIEFEEGTSELNKSGYT